MARQAPPERTKTNLKNIARSVRAGRFRLGDFGGFNKADWAKMSTRDRSFWRSYLRQSKAMKAAGIKPTNGVMPRYSPTGALFKAPGGGNHNQTLARAPRGKAGGGRAG